MGRRNGKEEHLRMGHREGQGSTSDMTFPNLNLLLSSIHRGRLLRYTSMD
jgi:hypothetical protein